MAVGLSSGGTAAVVGFGIGSLLTPLLTLRMSPDLAVAAVALPHLLATAVRLTRHASAVHRPTFLRFGLWSAAGGLAGALLQAALSGPTLLAILGALLVATSTAVALLVDLARTPVYLLRAGPELWALALPTAVAGLGCLLGTVWGDRLVGAGVAAVGLWLLARAL